MVSFLSPWDFLSVDLGLRIWGCLRPYIWTHDRSMKLFCSLEIEKLVNICFSLSTNDRYVYKSKLLIWWRSKKVCFEVILLLSWKSDSFLQAWLVILQIDNDTCKMYKIISFLRFYYLHFIEVCYILTLSKNRSNIFKNI